MRRVYQLVFTIFVIACITPTLVRCNEEEDEEKTTDMPAAVQYWNQKIPSAEMPETIRERILPVTEEDASDAVDDMREDKAALVITKTGLDTVDSKSEAGLDTNTFDTKSSPANNDADADTDADTDADADADTDMSTEEQNKAVSVGVGKGVTVGVTPAQPKPKAPVPARRRGAGAAKGKRGGGVGVNVGRGGVNVKRKPGQGTNVHVGNNSPFDYNYAADSNMRADPAKSMFLLEKNLHKGTKINLHLMQQTPSNATSYFLPRTVSDAIPFSSRSLPTAMTALQVNATSAQAEQMRTTLKQCESPAIRGESKVCVTSLESMIDFATLNLRTRLVSVVATEVPKQVKRQNYTILGFTRDPAYTKSVACHTMQYPYAVYLCHAAEGSSTSKVEVVGDDGARAQAVAVCHYDTSKWNPHHIAFQALHVKPGKASVCHFIPNDHLVWVPNP